MPDTLLGLSTHTAAQADQGASEADADYFCAGPVWSTPTKPGRPAAGLELVRHVASTATDRPWFAIGGISSDARLEQVIAAGARRVVVVRAITEAADPAAAARTIAARLQHG